MTQSRQGLRVMPESSYLHFPTVGRPLWSVCRVEPMSWCPPEFEACVPGERTGGTWPLKWSSFWLDFSLDLWLDHMRLPTHCWEIWRPSHPPQKVLESWEHFSSHGTVEQDRGGRSAKAPRRPVPWGLEDFFLTQHAPLPTCPISKEGGKAGEGGPKVYIKATQNWHASAENWTSSCIVSWMMIMSSF